jgi:hypothetical protein
MEHFSFKFKVVSRFCSTMNALPWWAYYIDQDIVELEGIVADDVLRCHGIVHDGAAGVPGMMLTLISPKLKALPPPSLPSLCIHKSWALLGT